MRVQHQQSYVLRTRAWSESSWIVDLFSRDFGRIGCIAKGARRLKSRTRPYLMPFQPLETGWSGKGELPTMTAVEGTTKPPKLDGERLLCAWYMNELLLRLLPRLDPHPALYDHYSEAINAIATEEAPDIVLRWFELKLLEECGYGLMLDAEISTGSTIEDGVRYKYLVDRGPVFADRVADSASGEAAERYVTGMVDVHGATLNALAAGDLSDRAVRGEARSLLRAVIDRQLDGRPLKTRRALRALRTRLEDASA